MEKDGLTCVVTVHGIGRQQPPDDKANVAGYADELHTNLRPLLGLSLGEDPQRPNGGPVYVQSEYPSLSKDTEKGLERIGKWDASRSVVKGADLTQTGASIAHVALVYSGDEEHVADPLAGAVIALLGIQGVLHYATPQGLTEEFGNNLRGLFHRKTPAASAAQADAAKAAGSQPLTSLVDHVGGYVARNVLRERVRVFVRDAVTRLAAREDVRTIVLNTHSNGTVIVFDVLPRIWPEQARKLGLFVTAGTPLRKYVHLLSWGNEVANWPDVKWINYYDIDDPVGDQLQPPLDVRITGDAGMGGSGLFVAYAPADRKPAVVDQRVNNVDANRDSHDYWGNQQFCKMLADQIMSA
jgi:hypothetical protein